MLYIGVRQRCQAAIIVPVATSCQYHDYIVPMPYFYCLTASLDRSVNTCNSRALKAPGPPVFLASTWVYYCVAICICGHVMPSGTTLFDLPASAAPGPLLLPALARSHRLAANARMCDDIITYRQSVPSGGSFSAAPAPARKPALLRGRRPPAELRARRRGARRHRGRRGVAVAVLASHRDLKGYVALAETTRRHCLCTSLPPSPPNSSPPMPVIVPMILVESTLRIRWLPVSTIRSGRGYPHWGLACPGKSLRGSIQFPRRQGGEYGIGFEIKR